MYRNPLDVFRLFLSLFQGLPPLPQTIYIPGAVLLTSYPVLSVLMGSDTEGAAFVTAFVLALAIRIAMGFGGMVERMRRKFTTAQTVVLALTMAVAPLIIIMATADPVWCQRMQSVYFLVVGAVFAADLLTGRTATAASFWPDAGLRDHLPNLTRMMVIFNGAFLVLNETMIHAVAPTHWLLFWALLPVIGQIVLRAMVLTVINLDDDQANPV